MRSETSAKKDTQKLQRAIVDGLEDVKAQDIQVFDSEHLSALFERVIIASGTSNRQTKALAASVRDAVREAGFPKPRIEGEENGEWIIVDCGQAVVHIMQPAIRQYYTLEQIWGDKPVRMRFGAPKPVAIAKEKKAVRKTAAKKDAMPADAPAPEKKAKKATSQGEPATAAKKPAAKPVAARKSPAKADQPVVDKLPRAKAVAPAPRVKASTATKTTKTAASPARKAAAKK